MSNIAFDVLELLICALLDKNPAAQDEKNSFPIDLKWHRPISKVPERLRHTSNLIARLKESLSEMDPQSKDYSIMSSMIEGIEKIFGTALSSSLPVDTQEEYAFLRENWVVAVSLKVQDRTEEAEVLESLRHSIEETLAEVNEMVNLYGTLATRRKGTVVEFTPKVH